MDERHEIGVPDYLLELAREAAGLGAISVEQALRWLAAARDGAYVELERWIAEARRLGSTMEAWPPQGAKLKAGADIYPRTGDSDEVSALKRGAWRLLEQLREAERRVRQLESEKENPTT
jgi:hypothetical protein